MQLKRWVRDDDCSGAFCNWRLWIKMCPDGVLGDGVNDSNLKSLRFFLSLSFSGDSSSIAQFRNRGRRGTISRSDLCGWHELRSITNHRLIMRVVEAQAFLSIDCFKVAAADKAEKFCVNLKPSACFLSRIRWARVDMEIQCFFINETFSRVGRRKSIKNPYVIVPRRGERGMVYYSGSRVNYFHRLIG